MKESNRVKFKCAVADVNKSILVSNYELIRMACYPLTLSEGKMERTVTLTTRVNGNVVDIAEQRQLNVSNDANIDPNLAAYYFLLQHHEPEELDLLVEDGEENAGIVEIELSFAFS
ncbi:hypothetical protein FG475_18985 [Vibrio navarrensis]|nr:hypothetical protein [Vibrio navarrensis]